MQVEKNNKPSTEGTEVQAVPAPTQLVAVDPRILNILMEDKIEQATERKNAREHAERKRQAYAEGSKVNLANFVNTVRKCKHLKGIRRHKNQSIDYNFHLHRFITSEERISCGNCGMKWWGKRQNGAVAADSREVVWLDQGLGFRSHPNPTFLRPGEDPKYPDGLPGLSFEDVKKMALESSSNTMTMSEAVLDNPQIKSNQLEKENADLKAQLEALQKGKE